MQTPVLRAARDNRQIVAGNGTLTLRTPGAALHNGKGDYRMDGLAKLN
ncbi:hypothetical protein J2Z49_000934 [Desulfofundulus luciae]|uniref:Uncharacterized protein n=1 Tax=Desulfofundulus luciae TaxID=74702 RepID=A0ABU0AZC8_9FIRM|nr:hypothetical protein [Desulfofundulus luciae]MDQ0285829.1 hypothetical protein [Desulfofundulus luciae]